MVDLKYDSKLAFYTAIISAALTAALPQIGQSQSKQYLHEFSRDSSKLTTSPNLYFHQKARKSMLYISTMDFEDFTDQSITYPVDMPDGKVNEVKLQMPHDLLDAMINSYINPTFYVDGNHIPVFKNSDINVGDGDFRYERYSDIVDLFDRLGKFDDSLAFSRQQGLDRLIILSHADSNAFQSRLTNRDLGIEKMRMRGLVKHSLSNLVNDDGEILIIGCAAAKGYPDNLTVAEYLAWVFQRPVYAAEENFSVSHSYGLLKKVEVDPNTGSINPIWHSTKEPIFFVNVQLPAELYLKIDPPSDKRMRKLLGHRSR